MKTDLRTSQKKWEDELKRQLEVRRSEGNLAQEDKVLRERGDLTGPSGKGGPGNGAKSFERGWWQETAQLLPSRQLCTGEKAPGLFQLRVPLSAGLLEIARTGVYYMICMSLVGHYVLPCK